MTQSSKRSGVLDATRKILVNGASVSAMIVHGACLRQTPRDTAFYYDGDGTKRVVDFEAAPA